MTLSINRLNSAYTYKFIKKFAVSFIKKYKLMIFGVIAVLVFSVFITTSHVNAKNSLNNRNKLYKSVMIYGGDTFDTLAEKYISDEYSSAESFIYEVKKINNLCNASSLTPGNHIIIPYYEDIVATQNNDLVIENDGCPVITISHESNNNIIVERF